jgi:serine/threonine protein kinase
MEYFPSNLYDYIQTIKAKRFSKLKLKLITFQLFRGLLYLQEKRIAHRDIKPHNILIRDTDLKVVICDFGSAKVLVPG